jgi:hypothetical protein
MMSCRSRIVCANGIATGGVSLQLPSQVWTAASRGRYFGMDTALSNLLQRDPALGVRIIDLLRPPPQLRPAERAESSASRDKAA